MKISRAQCVSARARTHRSTDEEQHLKTDRPDILARAQSRIASLRSWFTLFGILILIVGGMAAFVRGIDAVFAAINGCLILFVIYNSLALHIVSKSTCALLSENRWCEHSDSD